MRIVGKGSCVITAATTDGSDLTAECTVTYNSVTGIDAIYSDGSAEVNVYNLQGIIVLRNATHNDLSRLPAGIYIVRKGNLSLKVAVK